MPRNAQGEFSLVAGNPVVSGTPVSSTTHNSTMSDLAQGIRDSLDRSGRGGMLVPFKLVDGTSGAPAFAFTSEPATGLYRAGAADLRAAVVSIDVLKLTNAAVETFKPLTVGGALTVTGALSTTGAATVGGTLTVTGATGTIGGNSIWHAGNDGAASGLDADLLDGQHGAYYAPLASPTFTGTVTGPLFTAGATLGQKYLLYDGGAGARVGFGLNVAGLVSYNNGIWEWRAGGDIAGSLVMSLSASGLLTTQAGLKTSVIYDNGTAASRLEFITNGDTYYSSPTGWHVWGQAGVAWRMSLNANGDVVATGNVVAYGAVSDERLKVNLAPVEGALSKVLGLRAVTHEWNEEGLQKTGFNPTRGRVHGVIAQDVAKVMPDAVFDAAGTDNEKYLGVRYERLTVLLLAAVQELTERLRASGVRV